MSRRMIPVVAAALVVAATLPAAAASMKGKSDARLIALMLGDDDYQKRAEAAAELGERKSVRAIDAFGEVCMQGQGVSLCETAIAGLENIGTPQATARLHEIFMSERTPDASRAAALRVLVLQDPQGAAARVPQVLAHYRALEPELTAALLDAVLRLDLRDCGDMAVFIARDASAQRKARIKALDVAEAMGHQRMFDAYLGLIADEDPSIRARCARGLGQPGLPATRVGPALERLVHTDENSDVRAAALSSLRYYAHKDLLNVIQLELQLEPDPKAWQAALTIFLMLADERSLDTIDQLLNGERFIFEDTQIKLIHVLVRIGDRDGIAILRKLGKRTDNQRVVEETRAAAYLLKGSRAEREAAVAGYRWPEDVQIRDPNQPDVELPRLSVRLNKQQVLVPLEQ